MPLATLEAFDDHGDPHVRPLGAPDSTDQDADDRALRAAGVDLDAITDVLERDGVASFTRSYDELTACIEDKTRIVTR
jgi:transaldolase